MNFLMAYLNAAERIENIVGDHNQRPEATNKRPLISKTKICWLLLVLTVALPMAIFIGILQFFPSLMDISQDILNERKANKVAQVETVNAQPAWNFNGHAPPSVNAAYPPPPLYPPPAIARDEYHPKAAFGPWDGEGHRGAADDYGLRGVFRDLYPERNPYDRFQQPPRANQNYQTLQGLGHGAFGSLSAAVENSGEEEETRRGNVRSPELETRKFEIDSPVGKMLLSKIDPNWAGKVAAFKKRLQQLTA